MDLTLQKEIFGHAERVYPNECCGVIVQTGESKYYIPCHNLSEDPTEQFILCPRDFARAEDLGTITAIVHSHPDATPQPSHLDRAMCDDSAVPWIIVSWPEGDLNTIYPRGELPLIERPFVLGHSDCWGLVMSYFNQVHHITLNDYRVDFPWWEDGHSEDLYRDNWFECGFREFVGQPQPSDVILMQIRSKKWNHAGILLDGNMMLHHLYGRPSNRIPYGGYWRERTIKIVRHKDLM
ncbi:peptidase P60 [Pantoea sp. Al-1710]|uniref:Peptidase P60 n=1 Tax=Candidatus Pantoea communis TaxID=2608354 RepID=A0ABX0RI35_9GAMM|nr:MULTISPECIES: C40 family peptidase [Pantoea]NIG13033.1 peptidase P60 [Pantoea sp. Cy-640]NIG17266.1 peptidase P60 [Pantoea communis]